MPDEVAPLALIVPVLNEAQTINVFCQQHQAVFESYPLVFVDGGSTDGTPDLLKAMGFLVLTSEAGRGIQMNAGAQAVTAQYLLFLARGHTLA